MTPLRPKEEADDYRYFPEPDLVPVEPPRELVERLRGEVPRARGADPEARGGGRLRARARPRDERPRPALRPASSRPGRPARVANVLMNQFAAAGVDPAAVDADELAKLVEARDRSRAQPSTEALAASGDPGFSAERYLAEAVVADARARPVIERILAANPGEVEPTAAARRASSASSSAR